MKDNLLKRLSDMDFNSTDRKHTDIYGDFSEFYDFYVGDWLEDLPFYLGYSESLQTPILEIGAGSGRLTIPFAKAGKSIVAVDASASMLMKLKARLVCEPEDIQKRIRVIKANAAMVDLRRRYDLIIVPFYTFNYFLTSEVQKAALDSFACHLTGNGFVLVDVLLPLSRIKRCPAEPVLKCDTVDPVTGNRIRGWNIYSIDNDRQIEFRRHIFEVREPNGKNVRKEFTTQRRYLYPPELKELFTNSGFAVESVFTGYKKEAPKSDSEQLLYVLRMEA